MMLPPFAEVLHGRLRREERAEHVDVEDAVELLLRHRLDRRELVDARVVDEDVELAVALDRGLDDPARVVGLGHVAADGDRLAAVGGDGRHDGLRPGLAGGVVDDHRGTLGGERLGDGGADALGRAGDHCNLAGEPAHDRFPSTGSRRGHSRPGHRFHCSQFMNYWINVSSPR